MSFTKGQISLGRFWYTKFWVPDTRPAPPNTTLEHRPVYGMLPHMVMVQHTPLVSDDMLW